MSYINDNISRDMDANSIEVKGKRVLVFGRQGVARSNEVAFNSMPYFKILFYPDNSNFFKSYDLYIDNIKTFGYLDNMKEWNYICKSKIKPLVYNPNYEIYSFKTYVSIWYKRTDNFCDNYPTDKNNSYKELDK